MSLSIDRKTVGIFAVLLVCYVLAFFVKGNTETTYYQLISVLPLVVILVLLFMQVDMLVAALAGGVMAMIIGGIGLAGANKVMMDTVPKMLANTVPIINSAVATAVFKAGVYSCIDISAPQYWWAFGVCCGIYHYSASSSNLYVGHWWW